MSLTRGILMNKEQFKKARLSLTNTTPSNKPLILVFKKEFHPFIYKMLGISEDNPNLIIIEPDLK